MRPEAQLAEMMDWPAPREANYRDGVCCGLQARHIESRMEVRMMVDPPRTADRWLVLGTWQCMRREHHHGTYRYTTDEPARTARTVEGGS